MNKTKNVLLGLALGAVVLFSCNSNRQGKEGEVGQPKLSGKEKVAYFFKHERDERSSEESRASIEDFASWTKEEYDLYVDLKFEQYQQTPGVTKELADEKKAELYNMLNFGLALFGKYPYAFTPEEWNVFDKEYSKKKDCSKLSCPTKSFPNTAWTGSGYNTISSYVSSVNAQGQNDCDYEFETYTGGRSVGNIYGHSVMERVLNSNSGWLNYRTSGSYAYFLIGKWRIELYYAASVIPPAVDFRIQTR